MPWPEVQTCTSVQGGEPGLLCNGQLFLSTQRIPHIHTHTFELASRLGVQKHGVWDIPAERVTKYGNVNHFYLSLAWYARRELQEGNKSGRVVSYVVSTNASGTPRWSIVCRVLDEGEGSLGYAQEPTATRQGLHTLFDLKHAMIVVDQDSQNAVRWNLVTAYPVAL